MSSPGRAPQRGVALVFAAISLLASVAALALAIDLGRLYFERRDLQRVANMAALDASRAASGCIEPVRDPEAAAYNEARSSLLRNHGSDGDLTGGGVVTLGQIVVGDGLQRFASGSTPASAVQVQLVRDLPTRLLPGSGGSDLKLRAVAAARSLPLASLSVGSGLADLSPSLLDELLNQLLGGSPSLSLLSYRGLFNTSLPLGSLTAEAGVGTPSDFLTSRITAPEFFQLLADSLAASVDDATRGTLETLAAASDGSRDLTPGDAIGVPPGLESAAGQAVLNVGAVTQAAAQAANGSNLITIPADLNIPGVTGPASVLARLVETSTPVVSPASDQGGTEANNAQGFVQVRVPLLPILGTPASLNLWVQAAQATARVVEIECARSGRPHPVVHVRARASAARLGIGEFDDLSSATPTPRSTPLVSLNLLGIPIKITASAMADIGQDEDRELVFSGPFDTPQTQPIGNSLGGSLAGATSSLVQNLRLEVEPVGVLNNPLIRPLLQPVLNTLAAALGTVLGQLDEQLLVPVLAPLGLTLGGADVTVSGVTGDQPVLFNR